MKDIILSNNFNFNFFVLNKYKYTDNRKGSPYHYLAYMEKGSSKIVSNDITISIKAGEFFYIPKGLPYQSYWHSEDEIRFLSLGFNFFPESGDKEFLLQKINVDESLKEKIKKIPIERKTDSFILGEFYSVLTSLIPLMQYTVNNPKKQILEKAEKYIFENTNCKVSDIAKHCLLSESGLYNIFKKEIKLTPNELIQKIRCEKAVLILTTTDKSVEEVSDSLGFSSTSYFRKVLYRYTQKTPKEIRKSSKNM